MSVDIWQGLFYGFMLGWICRLIVEALVGVIRRRKGG